MEKGQYEERVIEQPQSVFPKVWTVCVVSIWTFVLVGYLVTFALYQTYGIDISYGMIVFLYPAIILTILFVIYIIYLKLH
ncbi:MAG: hypothetical protein ACFFE6_00235 [Candidatus Thorarchaeota archaeon]